MAKAVGVGGIFLKARDPKALSAWYATHLGVPEQGGGTLGFDGPIGVEVLNEYIRKWPLETAAAEAFAKTSKVVTTAREQWEASRR